MTEPAKEVMPIGPDNKHGTVVTGPGITPATGATIYEAEAGSIGELLSHAVADLFITQLERDVKSR